MTTAIALRPEERSELEAEAPRNAEGLAALEAMTLTTPEDLAHAGEILVAVKGRWKELEEKRTSVTKPLLAAKRAVDTLFDPVLKPLAAAEGVLKAKIGAYMLAERAAQVAAMTAVAAGEAPAETLATVVPSAAPAGVSMARASWEPEITNADDVPREYCTPDVGKLREAGWYADTEYTPPKAIPGVRWVLRAGVRVRA